MPYLVRGVFEEEEQRPEAAPVQEGAVNPYTDLTQDLGDRLTEYELVEEEHWKRMQMEPCLSGCSN